jgi:uncharacterized protein YuzE
MAAGDCEHYGGPGETRDGVLRSEIEEITMRIKVDKKGDALYFRLDESRIVESEEVRPGTILDFDEKDRVVGVEFLGISERATQEELSTLQFQTA